jgi:hypothetical protein
MSSEWVQLKTYKDYEVNAFGEVRHRITGKYLTQFISLCYLGKRKLFQYKELMTKYIGKDWVILTEFPSHEIYHGLGVRLRSCQRLTLPFVRFGAKEVKIERLMVDAIREGEDPHKSKIDSIKLCHPILTFDTLNEVLPSDRDNLLAFRFPELLDEWADTTEVGNILSFSRKEATWKCSEHGTYVLVIHRRTSDGTGCPLCEQASKVGDESCYTNVHRGAVNEVLVASWLMTLPVVKGVEHAGAFCNPNEDLVVELTNGKRVTVQVKTFTESKRRDDAWYFNTGSYPDDMLFLAVNEKQTRFFAALRKYLPTSRVTCTFNILAGKYQQHSFTTKESFLEAVTTLLPLTDELGPPETRYGGSDLLEYYSHQRFAKWCEGQGLILKRHCNNVEIIDAWVGKFSVQMKYRTSSNRSGSVSLTRSAGQGMRANYTVNDRFDFLVLEFSEREGEFCIIPFQRLVDMGYISTAEMVGRQTLTIHNPINSTDYWYSEYWNNAAQLH